MDVNAVTLEGRAVRLEPLDEEHAAGLEEAGDPQIFTYMGTRPAKQSVAAYQAYVQKLVGAQSTCAFAIVLRSTGQAVGVTTYMDIRAAHRGLEIGGTWVGRDHQGTAVNPECKYLLLGHAFEQLGAVRVQLKTDGRNLQSQRAIAKLGAVREGVLRRHMVLPDGYIRDTVMFSITDDEWPQVRAGLEARLQALL
jgi:RimJ/RimL family protein N-acetyltransferase